MNKEMRERLAAISERRQLALEMGLNSLPGLDLHHRIVKDDIAILLEYIKTLEKRLKQPKG